jgi:hypothetical protein
MQAPYYEEGRYECQVVSQGFIVAGTGTHQFKLKVKVLRCIVPFNDALDQQERAVYMSVTDKTVRWVLSDLHALGYVGDSLWGVDPDNPAGFHNFAGTQIELVCKHENDKDGKPRERWYVRPGEQPLKDKKMLHRLDQLLAKKQPKTNGSTAPDSSDKAPITDDDVPF